MFKKKKKKGYSLQADVSQSLFNTLICQSVNKDQFPLIKEKTFLSLKKIHLCSPCFVLSVIYFFFFVTDRVILGKLENGCRGMCEPVQCSKQTPLKISK